MDINRYMELLDRAEKLKNNTRHSWTSSGRHESVAEHSWRLAFMAYFIKDEFPDVDINKVILMCMMHDFGEAFTGDIPAFDKTSDDENTEENVIKEVDVNNRIMQEVATYIYNHYSERLILEDVAKKFNLSRSYLSKKFKSVTGFGFKEYIINVRIQHACELLLNTNKSITDIAFECGFNDSNYFGDAFRRTKGISPNKYRKNKEHM